MKKYLSLFAILFISEAISSCFAQATNIESTNFVMLQFNEAIHDYRHIKENGNGTYDFEFTNTEETATTFENIHSSFGCTAPTWPHEPILPVEQATIYVKCDTKKVGAFSKIIMVFANAADSPYKLQIKGAVTPLLDDE